MVNPIWLLPPVFVVLTVGAWLGAKVHTGVNRVVYRFARVLFGRFISKDADRQRTLQAAYISETYTGYASTTLLYTLLALLAGAVAGAYVIAGVLLVFEDFVRLLTGLPNTIAIPLGARVDYQLILSAEERWAILLGGGSAIGVISAVLAYVFRWQLPASDAEVRRRSIEAGLPRTTSFMYALSRGGLEFPEVLRTLTENREIYGQTADEMSIAVREMDLFGRDMITAIRQMSKRTPSEQFKTFSENLGSVLQSGSDLSEFLSEQYERFREDAEERQEEVLEVLATIAEGYVTVLVAGVLFLITILLVFGLTTTDTLWLIQGLTYLIVPLANVGFAVFLAQKLDTLGISRGGSDSILERYDLNTPIRSAPPSEPRRTDGGLARDGKNGRTLDWYDRISRVKSVLRSPLQTVIWKPKVLLYITVPLAVLVVAVRFPDTLTEVGLNERALDDVLVQSALFVLITYAIVRELYKRRIDRIEAATPELLERLASLNEAGMSVVEGFERVRGSDLGVLTPEVDRIWRDLEYGSNLADALVRFGRRVRTTAVTRMVVLLTHAMEASGNMGPVLRIAANQSRADLKMRDQRRRQMLTYLVVIYISFVVFLVIILAVNEVLVPSLPDTVPTPDSGNRLGVDTSTFSRLGGVDKAGYTLVFFHAALIQAVSSGFIAGQIGEGSLKDGTKHAAVMLLVAYVVFLAISSPVASINAGDATATGDSIRIESASLSSGGWVVVHDDGINSSVIGRSTYLEPGKHQDVTIQLDQNITEDRSVTIVPYQDSDEDRVFDYGGPPYLPNTEQADGPYESQAANTKPGVDIDVEYVGG
ncbi:type II secretion system F family protein [Salinibaculum rarum]|uniref:type II secretion system F family protein n=1 Tax=Salinibaculum rarum TaxID=3058903 RepID=UPI00265D9172|nr:type II secretion system F family protein [Salinibaculum sp. KK48]